MLDDDHGRERARASSITSRRSLFVMADARLCAFLDSAVWNCAGSWAWCMYSLLSCSMTTMGGNVRVLQALPHGAPYSSWRMPAFAPSWIAQFGTALVPGLGACT